MEPKFNRVEKRIPDEIKQELDQLKSAIDSFKSNFDSKLQEHLSTQDHLTQEQKDAITSFINAPYGAQIKELKNLIGRHEDTCTHLDANTIRKIQESYTRDEIKSMITSCRSGFMWDTNTYPTLEAFKERYAHYTESKETIIAYIISENCYYMFNKGKIMEFMVNAPLATEYTPGLMSDNDKLRLNHIEDNANNYIHPDNPDCRHITDEMISEFKSKADNILATDSNPGLMSAKDKQNLDTLVARSIDDHKETVLESSTTDEAKTLLLSTDSSLPITTFTDISKDIAYMLKNVTNNGTLTIPSGIYIIDSNLEIAVSNAVITGGPGVRIINKTEQKNATPLITINGSGNRISGLWITSEKYDPKASIRVVGMGNQLTDIYIEQTGGIELCGTDNHLHHIRCKLCSFGASINSQEHKCFGNKVSDCLFLRCVSAVEIVGSMQNYANHISNNTCRNGDFGIRCVGTGVKNNFITCNLISRGDDQNVAYGSGQYTIYLNANGNYISNNVCRGKDITQAKGCSNTLNGNML